jgi:hypothetical protein
MKERGQIVKKGTLSEDGNIEFWEDGTTTPTTYKRARKDSKTALLEGDTKRHEEDTEKHDEDPAMAGR